MSFNLMSIEDIAYQVAKNRYQGIYGWTDEQFDIFWNNPERNAFKERKEKYLEDAELTVNLVLKALGRDNE